MAAPLLTKTVAPESTAPAEREPLAFHRQARPHGGGAP